TGDCAAGCPDGSADCRPDRSADYGTREPAGNCPSGSALGLVGILVVVDLLVAVLVQVVIRFHSGGLGLFVLSHVRSAPCWAPLGLGVRGPASLSGGENLARVMVRASDLP